ncbi:MAG TPA: GIDE domain-containing protein [Micromonosporaceae bacterium]|jgi:hypothetical protein
MVVVVGVALVAVAVVGVVIGVRDWPLWNVLRRVRPTTPERLLRVARDGRLDGRTVAVFGAAGAGPDGVLRSAVNDEPCVWHRHVVHRRHITYRTSERGSSQRYSRRRRVADVASREPFLLRALVPKPTRARDAAASVRPTRSGGRLPRGVDGAATESTGASVVVVLPAGMRVHRPVVGSLRILPGLASEPFPAPDALLGRVARMYWHREWVIRPGAPLFVLGEVGSAGDRLTLARPRRGPHVVSTRTAGWLRVHSGLAVFGGLALAVVAGVAGAYLLIVHYLP